MSTTVLLQLSENELECLIINSIRKVLNEKPLDSDQLLTAKECAELLKLKLSTIYSKVSRGELPYIKQAGGKVYFSKKELIEHMRQFRRKTNVELRNTVTI